MTFADFSRLVAAQPDGVILLEGRRAIPADAADQARAVARRLATRFPSLRFRSGNAEGSDAAFSEGVAEVDASRLQIVAPYATHRRKFRYDDALYDSPESMSRVQEDEVAAATIKASPRSRSLIAQRGRDTAPGAKAAYLIRDTMKVLGHSDAFPRPLAGLFFIDPADPLAGGTGHTIRVCRDEGVPVVFQDDWTRWLAE